MKAFSVNGLMISSNLKTGCSLNVLRCQPTPWCVMHCYARMRTLHSIEEKGWQGKTTSNTGPVAWPRQQARYLQNVKVLEELDASGQLEETAILLANELAKRGITHLRGNGVGDLFPALTAFYAYLALHGQNVFMFSRIPSEISDLYRLLVDMDVPPPVWPRVIGSCDPSTTASQVAELTGATTLINHGKAMLAYATEESGIAAICNARMAVGDQALKVVFGYHTHNKHTKIDHPIACPAANGEPITCLQCRRCIDR